MGIITLFLKSLFVSGIIFLADPTVFVENGKYYMTGTRGGNPAGFTLLESQDLKHWRYTAPDSMILRKGADTFGNSRFWAPQIFKCENGYLLAYCADEQVAIAQSDSVAGLYTQSETRPVDRSGKNIDPFIFRDDDGKYYLYHVRFDNGNFIWVGEYDPERGTLIPGTLRQCLSNDQAWEKTDAFPAPPIMEGPTVIKIDGRYYLFYSANHYLSPDYAVGYATSRSPLGPWVKNPSNPIIHSDIVGEKGSGHGDLFYDNEGKMRYVYHVHNNAGEPNPRQTRIITLKMERSAGLPAAITADPDSNIVPVLDSGK